MTKNPRRLALPASALAMLVAVAAPSCGSSDATKAIAPGASGDAGEGGAGESGPRAGAGGTKVGVAGAGTANGGGEGGARPQGTAGEPSGAGEAATAGASSAFGGEAGDGGAAGAGGGPPDVVVGADCLAPSETTRLSAASAGLPTDGLTLWLRADHGVYKTAAGRVCAWLDQSGHASVFYPEGEGTRPLWEATSMGSAPAIHFDASGRYVIERSVLGIAAQSARTFIAVIKLVDLSSRCEALEQGFGGTGEYLEIDANTFSTAGNREGVVVMNNAYDTGLATAAVPRVHIYTINPMTIKTPIIGAIDYRVNGATQTLTRNGGAGDGTFETFADANYTALGACSNELIAEALIYDRALTVPEREAVEASLEERYGIQ